MRRFFFLFAFGFLAFTLSGCSSTMVTNPMVKDSAGVSMDGARILNRPVEYSIKEGQKVVAEAKRTTLLGFIPVDGANVKLKAPVLGLLSSKSKAQAAACKKILEENPDSDGLLVTQAFVERGGIPGIYSYEKATIKGRTISLVNLGMLNEEEAVAFRTGKWSHGGQGIAQKTSGGTIDTLVGALKAPLTIVSDAIN